METTEASAAALSDRQQRFVEKARIGRLATISRDGAPHIAPVWYRYEDGAFLILTERGSQKHRNIERDARVEFCIDDEQPPYHTVLVRGTATVEPAHGREWREALAVHYLGEEAGKRYTAANDNPDGIVLRIVPRRIIGW